MKKTLFSLLSLTVFIFSSFSQTTWQQLNGPYGGAIKQIVSSPGGELYAIASWAVFKSVNEGTDWVRITPPYINNLKAGGAAPNGYIYLVTGNFTSKIYRSTNGGATWEERLPNGGYEFNDFTTTSNGTVLAGTFYMFSFHGQFIQSGDIYRSTDHGNTFTQTPFPDLAVNSLKAAPNGDIYVATINGLFKSNNGGAGWFQVRNDTCYKIFINPQGHIFFLSRQQVYRSTDNGNSWLALGNRLPMVSTGSGILLTAEGGNIYRSSDNGASWAQTGLISNAPLFDVYSMITAGSKILAGSELGVYKSENAGSNWSQINNGISVGIISTIAAKGQYIFTGAERYISRSTDNGTTWTNLSGGLPSGVGAYKLIINNNGSVFAFVNSAGLYRSENNGDNWTRLLSVPAGGNSGLMAVNSNSELFLASPNTVYKSTDNGNTWNNSGTGLPTDQPAISGISCDRQNNLYASVRWGGFNSQDGVFKSSNGGASWIQINDQFIEADFKFTSGNHIYTVSANRLMRSVNSGVNFEIVPTAPDYVIEMEIGENDQLVIHYVENEVYGIKRSTNNGESWVDFIQGLGQLLVYDFAFEPNNHLLAATQSGLFRTTSSTLGISLNSRIPSGFKLHQNYPNPFNPDTKISFEIPETENVSLIVYNSAGEETAVLIRGTLTPGVYDYTWSAKNLASGVYFYKITAGTFTDVKKMILIK